MTTVTLDLSCAAKSAQFPTLPRPPSPPKVAAQYPDGTPTPTLLAEAQHLRTQAVRALLLALSVGDEAAVAVLLAQDGQLAREQQSVPLTAHALLNELHAKNTGPSQLAQETGLVLSGQVVGLEGPTGLVVQVEGSSTVRGPWTVVFSDAPVNRIKELRLPPRAT